MFNRLLRYLLGGSAVAFLVLALCSGLNFDYSSFMILYSIFFVITTLVSALYTHRKEQKHSRYLVSSYTLIAFSAPFYLIWFIFA